VTEAEPSISASTTPLTEVQPAPESGTLPVTPTENAASPELPPEPVPLPTEVMAGSAPKPDSGAAKPAYPPAPAEPTQHGRNGLHFDFNDGYRCSCRKQESRGEYG
jgi:hypothetical protein